MGTGSPDVAECTGITGLADTKGSLDNLDNKLEKYLKRYFPKEAKEKQRANEIERGIEIFGPSYKHTTCLLM